MGDLLSQFAAWLLGLLQPIWQWFLDVAEYIPKWAWSQLLAGLAAVINEIPVPGFVSDFTSYIGSIDGGVIWFLDLMQFKYGLGVMSAALLARFLLRRIPLIG